MMIRRSFGTIHEGHVPPLFEKEWFMSDSYPYLIDAFFAHLKKKFQTDGMAGYTAGAFALEEGSQTERRHIQFYVEHSRKRPRTLAMDFGVSTEAVFDRVRDAQGSWNYCTQSGTHSGKEGVLDAFVFGEPKLHGDTHKADLKLLVSLILDGLTPIEILKEYPYAYCVHRRRIWDLYRDIKYGVDESEFLPGGR